MTKKDYIAIAAVIKVANNQGDTATCKFIARNIADVFQSDNSKFDRARFLRACGIED